MAAVLAPELVLRAMVRQDLDQITAIEQASYPFPWSRGIFADCLRIGYRCLVLEVSGEISGYSVSSLALDEGHLLNLCVASNWRRQGLGVVLLDQVVRDAKLAGMVRLFLEVRPSNQGARKLYKTNGFRVIGRRPGYYPADDGREDAVIMVRHLDEEDF
ncbi:MAG: ribosomal-protein-alanine N-acetyltransferase [Wenzhouxiangella sp.]|nr:MAG: ribosomal-protein-alanine N-acetyltransferase [Wenzhouxiangella sp.]